MKKLFKLFVALFILIAAAVPSAHAEFQDMWAAVYSWDGKVGADGKMVLTRVTSGITFAVYAANTDTAETLYYYNVDAMTSLTNPVSTTNFESSSVCNDMVAFRVDPTETNDRYVDLIVVNTSGGYTAFVEDFDKYTHAIVIDQRPNIMHHGSIWWAETTQAEVSTGVSFLPDTIIHRVAVETTIVAASQTIDVGLLSSQTSGDADGFCNNASAASAVYVNCGEPVVTAGTTETYISTAAPIGALMGASAVGADAQGSDGVNSIWEHHITYANATTLTYSAGTTAGTASGFIHYWFTRTR